MCGVLTPVLWLLRRAGLNNHKADRGEFGVDHTQILKVIEDGGGELHITPLSGLRHPRLPRSDTPAMARARGAARPMSLDSDYSELYTPSLLVPTH